MAHDYTLRAMEFIIFWNLCPLSVRTREKQSIIIAWMREKCRWIYEVKKHNGMEMERKTRFLEHEYSILLSVRFDFYRKSFDSSFFPNEKETHKYLRLFFLNPSKGLIWKIHRTVKDISEYKMKTRGKQNREYLSSFIRDCQREWCQWRNKYFHVDPRKTKLILNHAKIFQITRTRPVWNYVWAVNQYSFDWTKI